MKQRRYEVLVGGTLPPNALADFGDSIHVEAITVISGQVRDQSQLYAVLRELRSLGIDVMSVNTQEVPADAD